MKEKRRIKDGVANREDGNSENPSVATEEHSSLSISDIYSVAGPHDADYNCHLYQQRCKENPRLAWRDTELSIDINKRTSGDRRHKKICVAIGSISLFVLILCAIVLAVVYIDMEPHVEWKPHHNNVYKFNMAEERRRIALNRKPPTPRVHSEEELRALDEFLASSSYIKDVTGQNNRARLNPGKDLFAVISSTVIVKTNANPAKTATVTMDVGYMTSRSSA